MSALRTERRLTITSVVSVAIPTVAPIAMGAAVVPLANGRAGLPAAVVAAGLVLLALTVGQITMIRRIANGGSLAAIVASGLGRPAGMGAAWLVLAAYGGLQIALYGLLGPATSQLLGHPIDWWVPALMAWAVVTATGIGRAQLPRQTTDRGRRWGLMALALLEIGSVVVIVLIAALGHPANHSLGAISLFTPGAGVLVLPVLFALAGLETSARFAESGAPRAATGTGLAILIGTALLAALAWALRTSAGAGLLATRGYAALVLISTLAALASGQATVIRHAQLLGLERVRPGDLPRNSALPAVGGFAALALAGILLVALLGGDPQLWLLRRLGMISSFGLLFLLALTALATVSFLGQQPGRFPAILRPLAAPAVATLALGGLLAAAMGELDRLLDVSGLTALLLAVLVPVVVACGAGWSLVVRRRWPYRYWAIGLGANSLTGVASSDQVSAPPYTGAHMRALSGPPRRRAILPGAPR